MRPDTPLWMLTGAAAWGLLTRLLREQTTFKPGQSHLKLG
jgi:hypothetical protein